MTGALYEEYLERVNALEARIASEERDSIMRAVAPLRIGWWTTGW